MEGLEGPNAFFDELGVVPRKRAELWGDWEDRLEDAVDPGNPNHARIAAVLSDEKWYNLYLRVWCTPSYYAMAGVLPTATAQQIKAAFRKLWMAVHPDKSPECAGNDHLRAQANANFARVTAACTTLKESRKEYDAAGAPHTHGAASDEPHFSDDLWADGWSEAEEAAAGDSDEEASSGELAEARARAWSRSMRKRPSTDFFSDSMPSPPPAAEPAAADVEEEEDERLSGSLLGSDDDDGDELEDLEEAQLAGLFSEADESDGDGACGKEELERARAEAWGEEPPSRKRKAGDTKKGKKGKKKAKADADPTAPQIVQIACTPENLLLGFTASAVYTVGEMTAGGWTNLSRVRTYDIPPRTPPGVFLVRRGGGMYRPEIKKCVDLHFVLELKPGGPYTIDGLDVHADIEVPFVEAVCSTTEFVAPDTGKREHHSEPVWHGTRIELRKRGLRAADGAVGNLVCDVVVVPPRLSTMQRAALVKFMRMLTSDSIEDQMRAADAVADPSPGILF